MWVFASKDSVNGEFYGIDRRPVCSSSANQLRPSTVEWVYRENDFPEDPWISPVDHFDAIDENKILYAEDGTDLYTDGLATMQGSFVMIKNVWSLDKNGCG